MEHAGNPIYVPHSNDANNMLSPLELELSVILYQDNQFANTQLWNSNFASILLFSTDKYLVDDMKNIVCSLVRIAVFIKQQHLSNRNVFDIP